MHAEERGAHLVEFEASKQPTVDIPLAGPTTVSICVANTCRAVSLREPGTMGTLEGGSWHEVEAM